MGWVLAVCFLIALSWVMEIFSFFMQKAQVVCELAPELTLSQGPLPPMATLSTVLRSSVISVLIALEYHQAF